MITKIKIENFKSIQSLELDLGRLNVFIGANGSGKSNILEGIAFGSAAMENKLDDEFLANRGFRTNEPNLLKPRFDKGKYKKNFYFAWQNDKQIDWGLVAQPSKDYYGKWSIEGSISDELKNQQRKVERIIDTGLAQKQWLNELKKAAEKSQEAHVKNFLLAYVDMIKYVGVDNLKGENILKEMPQVVNNQINESLVESAKDILNFMIYSPENYFLRRFEEEAQIKPLGFRGEGLFKLLTVIKETSPEIIEKIEENLKLLEWFDGFEIPKDLHFVERRLNFKDSFLDSKLSIVNQKSVNEGALFLLFYFTLFINKYSTKFFAIDNIDNAMNPKLGKKLVKTLGKLAVEHDKQAILTTHNPAILDGLNLTNPDLDQRLFVVYRDADGGTSVRRILPKKIENGATPVPLSEQFLRGYLGGLPDNF
jgi:AAA15 family ATPase/GTPase